MPKAGKQFWEFYPKYMKANVFGPTKAYFSQPQEGAKNAPLQKGQDIYSILLFIY